MRLLVWLSLCAIFLSACNGQGRKQPNSINEHEPIAKQSTLNTPKITGPITGGLRNQPWASISKSQTLSDYGYIEEEYFYEGSARARDITAAEIGQDAFYRSRLLVRRPEDPRKFNGTVLVEWFNDSGFMDLPVMWVLAHEEILREGYAYVGVSAQTVGVQSSPLSLKLWDPVRYSSLTHPGDEYAHDIFGQAVMALLPSASSAILGQLNPKSIIAMGESQSCTLLSQYRNKVHQDHGVFDGYLLHSCNSNLDPTISAPTILFMNESEVTGFYSPSSNLLKTLGVLPSFLTDIPGLGVARLGKLQEENGRAPSEDEDFFRVWEIAGGTHFDRQALAELLPLLIENLTAPLPPLLALPELPVGCLQLPNQLGMERPTRAAIHQLNQWVTYNNPAKTYARLLVDEDESTLKRDTQGIALGGIRLPTISTPYGVNRGDDCPFIGSFTPFTNSELQQYYSSKEDYLSVLHAAIVDSIEKGYLRPEDGDLYILEAEQEIPSW